MSGGESDPGWGTVVLLEYDDRGPAFYPQVAADGSGNMIAVWQQQDGTRNHIWSNRYVVGDGWGDAEMIEDEPLASTVNPRVAADPDGNAFAVWEQVGAVGFDIWSNRYVAGEGWGTAELVESSSLGSATDPELAVDGSGNAFVVWVQVDLYQQSTWSNRYSVGTGWGAPELIEADDSTATFNPTVSVDPSGNATAVWEHWGGSAMTVWSNRYVVGDGWGATEVVDTEAPSGDFNPQVAMDRSGNAVAVWERWDGDSMEIAANRYVVGAGWGTSGYIGTGSSGNAAGPKVTVGGAGDAMVVWSQYDDGYYNIWSCGYVPGTGWGSAEMVGVNRTLEVRYAQVGSDGSGNAISVWEEWDGAEMDIWSNRYAVGEGWGVPEMTHPDDWCTAISPQVAVDSTGNAVAVWQMYDGTRHNIWASRYVAPDTTAPELSIDSPSDGYTTEEPTVMVTGATEPGATLDVNGLMVTVGPDGSFSCSLALIDGVNIITATATDASGNAATASVTVTYDDPTDELVAQLEAAMATIATLEADLSTAMDGLAALQDEYDSALAYAEDLEALLDAALEDAESLQALLDATLAELAGVRSDLNDSEESYSAILGQLDEALANVTAAEEDIAILQEEVDTLEDELAAADEDLDTARSQNLLLTAVVLALGALCAALSLMFLRSRKGKAAGRAGPSEKEPPPPDDGA
ncbi:MAG: hypothetical protein AB1793_01180 [Candidatus Thermoplasmatota archaeon]